LSESRCFEHRKLHASKCWLPDEQLGAVKRGTVVAARRNTPRQSEDTGVRFYKQPATCIQALDSSKHSRQLLAIEVGQSQLPGTHLKNVQDCALPGHPMHPLQENSPLFMVTGAMRSHLTVNGRDWLSL